MIERQFVLEKTKELKIKQYLNERLRKVGLSQIKVKKIPLGEKIVIQTSRPSLIVGSKGSNIKELTRELKQKFHMENPQIEILEIKEPYLDPHVVAEKIVSSLERFGASRFKGVGHKMMEQVMQAGALGVEIVVSGKLPSARARSWRFYAGYLKKCGSVAMEDVRIGTQAALLKSGIIGVKVMIMPPDVNLPDKVVFKEIAEAQENKGADIAPAAPMAQPVKEEKKMVEA